jgi:negative regulator of flagellin synthesis FlgM
MPIEINGQPGNSQVQNQQRSEQTGNNATRASVSDEQTGNNNRGSDTVSLTDSAARLQSIQARLANVPIVDSQRVDNIRQALNEGGYQIDTNAIADRLLAFETSLFSAK